MRNVLYLKTLFHIGLFVSLIRGLVNDFHCKLPVDLLYLARFVHRKVFKTVTLVCLICFSWWGLLSGHELSLYKNAPAALLSRVANVVAHHDELLTQ